MLCYNLWQVILMKKSQFIIPTIMTIIVLILVCCIFLNSNKKEEKAVSIEGTWQKEIIIYSNSQEYGTIKEEYNLKNSQYIYNITINYNDKNIENAKFSIKGAYQDKKNYIVIDKKYLYLDNNNLCLEQTGCSEPFSKEKIQYKHELFNFNAQNYIFEPSHVENGKEKSLYLIVKNKCDECEILVNNASHLTSIFDTSLNIINIDNLSKTEKTALKDYDITEYPCIIIIQNNKILNKLDNAVNLTNFAKFLIQNDYKFR